MHTLPLSLPRRAELVRTLKRSIIFEDLNKNMNIYNVGNLSR